MTRRPSGRRVFICEKLSAEKRSIATMVGRHFRLAMTPIHPYSALHPCEVATTTVPVACGAASFGTSRFFVSYISFPSLR